MASTSAPVSPVTVPLHPKYVSGTGYKIGVRAGFEPGSFRLYEFDTGGIGFWSGFSPQWWPEGTGPAVENHYASGITYQGCAVPATVYLADGGARAAASAQATVAQIHKATGKEFGGGGWQKDMNDGTPPLYGHFFGDFGASLRSKDGLRSVLAQLPDGRSNGFAVTLGAFPADPAAPVAGSLQLGLSDDEIESAAGTLPLVPIPEGLSAQGVLYVNGEPVGSVAAGSTAPAPVQILFDSGCPSTHVWTGTGLPLAALQRYADGPPNKNGTYTLGSGVAIRLVSGSVAVLDFTSGDVVGLNRVTFSPVPAGSQDPAGYVNTGLQPFWGNRVAFRPAAPGGFIALSPASSPAG